MAISETEVGAGNEPGVEWRARGGASCAGGGDGRAFPKMRW